MGTQVESKQTGAILAKRLARPGGPVLEMYVSSNDFYLMHRIPVECEGYPDDQLSFGEAVALLLTDLSGVRVKFCSPQIEESCGRNGSRS